MQFIYSKICILLLKVVVGSSFRDETGEEEAIGADSSLCASCLKEESGGAGCADESRRREPAAVLSLTKTLALNKAQQIYREGIWVKQHLQQKFPHTASTHTHGSELDILCSFDMAILKVTIN